MTINVHMLSFYDDRSVIRTVNIPDNLNEQEEILEATFKYGQNDFQPLKICSVSVGDVAELNGKYFMCMGIGWKELSKEEFDALIPPTSKYAHNPDNFKKYVAA